MKIIDKVVVSSTPPTQTQNIAWFDGKELKIPNNGKYESIGGSGGGIEIVDSVDKLDPNAELGSMASVVTAGSIQETSVRNLYQPDASMFDETTGTLTQPELLQRVSSIKVFTPTDVSNIDFEIDEGAFFLATKDSYRGIPMAIIDVTFEGVFGTIMVDESAGPQEFLFVEFLFDTASFIIHDDQVEAFNAILANGMDWCYLGNPETSNITENQFNMIDLFVKAVADVPSITNIYIKGERWEQLYQSDLNRISSRIDAVGSDLSSLSEHIDNETNYLRELIDKKSDKMPIATYPYGGLQPNVYTTRSISSTGSITIKLAAIADTTIYNEYILELKCTSTPSSVAFNNADGTAATIKWVNDTPPTFEAGFTYLISIANNLAVFAQYTNS